MNQNTQKIIESLSPIERKVLPNISENLDDVIKNSQTDKVTVLRALDFLEKKDLLKTEEKNSKKVIDYF